MFTRQKLTSPVMTKELTIATVKIVESFIKNGSITNNYHHLLSNYSVLKCVLCDELTQSDSFGYSVLTASDCQTQRHQIVRLSVTGFVTCRTEYFCGEGFCLFMQINSVVSLTVTTVKGFLYEKRSVALL